MTKIISKRNLSPELSVGSYILTRKMLILPSP